MAGEAKSAAFMLGTATVMLGPPEDVFDLTPDEHSIGLVKNFKMAPEIESLPLTQGVRNTKVYEVMTGFPISATFDVFEYTARNIAYSIASEGFKTEFDTKPTGCMLSAGLVAGATTCDIISSTDISAAFTTGTWIVIQELVGGRDLVAVARLTSNGTYATNKVTLKFTNHPIPMGMAFSTNARVRAMSAIGLGASYEMPNLGMKVVGILPERNEPITLICFKVRVVKGFNLSFVTSDYGSMPFEVSLFEQVPSDPHYAYAAEYGQAMLLTGN